MTTQQDAQIGISAAEGTFGTVATPVRFPEFLSETFNWVPTFTPNDGMRVGRVVGAADRRVLTKSEVSGDLEVELFTKGLGGLFFAALGAGTSTLISGSAYQQLFTPSTTDYLPSYTIQKGLPPLGGGAAQPQTYAGMVCGGFDLTVGNVAIPTVKFSWMGKSVDTSTALTAASYISGNGLFSFVNGSITVGGSVTVPTTTALASGGTSVADIRDFSLSYSNNLDGNGFNLGGNGTRSRKPAMGERTISGQMTAEYDNNTLRDAFLAQSDLALVLNFATTTAISGSNYPALQITIPDIRLDGELPKANKGDVITQSVGFTGLDGRVAASPIYVAIVTAETAI